MRLLPVLFILTSINAKRRRLENDEVNIKRRTEGNDVDVYPGRFSDLDFGHVYRNGDRKKITDNEPDMIEPRNVEHARQLLRKIGSYTVNMKEFEEPLGFSNPRDAFLYNKLTRLPKNEKNMGHINGSSRIRNVTQFTRKPLGEAIKERYPGYRLNIQGHPPGDIPSGIVSIDNDTHKEQFFSKSNFGLVSDETYYAGNWTTCKEFGKGAVFHPDDVIDLPWVPFYIWSTRRFVTSIVHTLAYPTKKLVKQYKKEFEPYLNIKIDWEQPKLLLKESRDMLLIAGDRKGLFYGIPYIELPSSAMNSETKLTVAIIRLKIVNPYLAMMYCNENYATIMSVAGTEPESDEEKLAEAAILQFKGIGNPASRDLELEAHKTNYEIEWKRKDEEQKYIKVERPNDRLDPSLW